MLGCTSWEINKEFIQKFSSEVFGLKTEAGLKIS
jgi:hypothetical protein